MPKFFMCLPVPWTEDAKECYVEIDCRAKYSVGSEIMNRV